MSKYAIVKIKGTQYKVSEGDEILVDKISKTLPDVDVLMVVDGSKVKIGKPLVSGAKIKVKVLEKLEKGKKIHVLKYKAKSRYRKKIGFRPLHSRLLIEKITP